MENKEKEKSLFDIIMVRFVFCTQECKKIKIIYGTHHTQNNSKQIKYLKYLNVKQNNCL